MKIDEQVHGRILRQYKSMIEKREPWLANWRELAQYILPRRYTTLEIQQSGKAADLGNGKILDGTQTIACEVLSSGMLNGITSPARPWFRMRVAGFDDDTEVQLWLDDTVARMTMALSESNFYTSFATLFSDLSCFATGGLMIYEDDEDVFRCYNYALGEYALLQDSRGVVTSVGYGFRWRVEDIVKEFGLENCSDRVRKAWEQKGARRNDEIELCCLLEPNSHADGSIVAAHHTYRQLIWEANAPKGVLLDARGFREWPGVFPRWKTIGSDAYGTGPSHDAFADIKQLQHMTKRKAQGMDVLISPPMIASNVLANRQKNLAPGGITFVPDASAVGMKPAYQINLPIREMTEDIMRTQERIREFFYNDLFKMISRLDTVRSATEIDQRVEEKLVLLGPVLERFQKEGLDVALNRIFGIMSRKGLLLPTPPQLQGQNVEVQYVSILADAQRAVGAAPVERYISLVGNIAGAKPDVLDVPDWDELLRWYSEQIGVPVKLNKTPENVQALREQRAEAEQGAMTAEAAPGLAQAGKNLSETQVGGGANALQMILGGGV